MASSLGPIPSLQQLPVVVDGPGLAFRGHFIPKDEYKIFWTMMKMSTDPG